MLISVIIPFYNTRECVRPLYDRLLTTLNRSGWQFELICVDDKSPQKDWEVIEDLAQADKRVKLVRLVRNFGQQAAISAGLAKSCGDWVVVMDADLQDKPEEIPNLLHKAMEGYNIVFALRGRRKDTWLKKLYSWMFHRMFKLLSGMETDTRIGNFGVYSRKVINAFLTLKEGFRGFNMLVSWLGFDYTCIDVDHQERIIGKSSYTFKKGLLLAMDAFVAFSDTPLKLTALSGFILAFISMLVGIIFLIRFFLGYTLLLGWTSLILSIWFLSGVIIMIMGIIGLYLGKIFAETKNRPHYLIDYTINIDE
ncbi:MAG: glycosyltransferase family 2 protein [Candidatus Cloacimonetes bacterium]|nr:glycosyltransferase family 2 protein [Candidatus Cloacimonadota bacterium]